MLLFSSVSIYVTEVCMGIDLRHLLYLYVNVECHANVCWATSVVVI